MKKPTCKEIFTIPNMIGYLRILLVPVICWVYLTARNPAQYWTATGIVLFSSLTDLFDGKIARRFNQVTDLGKILDPVADKLTHAALAICLAMRHHFMWALIALMVVKEGYMGFMGIKLLRKGRMLNGAMWFGKVCTACLFAGLLVMFAWYDMPLAAVNGTIAALMVIMLVTLCLYVPEFKKLERKTDEVPAPK